MTTDNHQRSDGNRDNEVEDLDIIAPPAVPDNPNQARAFVRPKGRIREYASTITLSVVANFLTDAMKALVVVLVALIFMGHTNFITRTVATYEPGRQVVQMFPSQTGTSIITTHYVSTDGKASNWLTAPNGRVTPLPSSIGPPPKFSATNP